MEPVREGPPITSKEPPPRESLTLVETPKKSHKVRNTVIIAGTVPLAILGMRELVHSAAQPDYSCHVAIVRATDPNLQNTAEVNKLIETKLYEGGTTPQQLPMITKQLQGSNVGKEVSGDDLGNIVDVEINKPANAGRIDEKYASVTVDPKGLGYIIDYGSQGTLKAIRPTGDSSEAIQLVQSCTLPNRGKVVVHAGSISPQKYSITLGK